MNGRPNPVDTFLGTLGVHGKEGGPLCFLVWAVPQIVGSLVYDVVVRHQPGRASHQFLVAGIALVVTGYGLSSLSSLYPVARGPQPVVYVYPETEQVTESPVLPLFTQISAVEMCAYFRDPPFILPPAERIRLWNYWMLSRWLATLTFMLTTTGFGLLLYVLLVVLCEAGGFQLRLLRTFRSEPTDRLSAGHANR